MFRGRVFASIAGLVCCVFLTASAAGRIIYVKPGGTGSGKSWTSACGHLQQALDTADPNDQIWVAAGTYKPINQTDPADPRTACFQMKPNVAIYGGFAGMEDPNTFHLADRDFQTNETILSGDIGIANDPNDNTYHVIYNPQGLNLDPNAILDGFTISNGNANGNSLHKLGGGILNSNNRPYISKCIFDKNSSVHGGGIYNDMISNPIIIQCVFSNNNAESSGGGLSNGSLDKSKIIGCVFINNHATRGGGISIDHATFNTLISDCIFERNSADSGGGICHVFLSGDLKLTNCTFIGNTVTNSGGGINANNLIVNNCVFTSNSASSGGGISANNITASNCIFFHNSVSSGGGISINDESENLYLRNCSFHKNIATKGNSVAFLGVRNVQTFLFQVKNSIIWDGSQWFWKHSDSTVILEVKYSDIQRVQVGIGNINLDPCFVDFENANYHLRPGSPCIDAGDNSAIPPDLITDLDGNPRFVDDPDTPDTGYGTAPIVDMGPYEFGNWFMPADFSHDWHIDLIDFSYFSAAWLTSTDQPDWNPACNLDNTDNAITLTDLALFAESWLK